jgi:DNA repair exonuclease SbcCD ATPase subunit
MDQEMNLENQVEMLREIASDLKRMLAVHDEKLNQHERKQDDIFALIEQRRNDMAEDIKEIHSRITTVQRELCTEITATENRIIKGIDELKEELKTDQEFHNSKQKTLEQRIADLEKWRWIIIGAGITGGWVFSKLSTMVEIIVK